jgi:outer membrane usher protein
MQADEEAQQVGSEMLFGTSLGLVSLDLAASRTRTGREGFAGALSYEKILQSGSGSRSLSVRGLVEVRSNYFATPGSQRLLEPQSLRASGGLALTLGRDSFVAMDAQYSRNRSEGTSRYSTRATAGVRLMETLAAVTEVEWEKTEMRRGAIARIGLRKRIGNRSSAQLDVDSKGVVRTSYQATNGLGIGAWSASADVRRVGDNVALNANGTWLQNRFELGVSQFGSYGDGRLSEARTSVRAGTSLAFADGAVAISRPIQQAFLIAEPHLSLGGKPVRIDPREDTEQARSGALGGAVDGNLSAYSPRTLLYDVPDAPPGYDLGAGNVQVLPPYKAGYRLEVGSDYNLLVIGRLLDDRGEPIALLAGKAIDLNAPKRPAVTMFTSRGGKFGAQGLRAGKWRIEMPTQPSPTIFEVEVRADSSGTVRIGDIRPTGSVQ